MTADRDSHGNAGSPMPAPARVLFDWSGGMTLHVDLPTDEESLWVPLVRDIDQLGKTPRVGFMRLERVFMQNPGLTTYRVAEVAGPDSPPPSTAPFRTIFRVLSLEEFEFARRARSAVGG